MEVSPSMSDLFYHHQQQQQQQQQQQARMASVYLERMSFPYGYPQYPIYPSFRGDDYGRRRAVLPLVRFDPMNTDFPMEARPRSGSLGSTASSLRDGPSPSFDSVTGGSGSSDSVSSRDSPFSFTSSSPSPSPLSPPTPGSASDGGSKLRRVLMGTLSSPYSVLCRRVCPSPRDVVAERNSTTPPAQRKRKYDSVQTTPMDLSCKRSCSDPRATRPCSGYDTGPRMTPSPARTSMEDAGHPSILKAILCGRHAEVDRRVGNGGASPSTTGTTTTHSAMSPTGGRSPCPATTTANSCSTALPVTLAKKNLLPVSARVLDWLLRTVRFARALPQFASLSHHDKVALLLNSWPRVLLLYMAETDFEFAVTAVPCVGIGGGGNASAFSPAPATPLESANVDGEVPTMNSVEGIQRFIRKCQALNLDSTEYEYMRVATIFHRGCLGVEDASYVDSVNTYVRRALRDHIATLYPSEKLRYSSILLCLPGLFAINGRVVEALFCRQVVSDCDDTESMLKELLTRDSSATRAH